MGPSAFDLTPGKGNLMPHTGTPRVVFSDVRKTFDGTDVISGVGFVINRGEIHALLGANGAGKSTLIKLLSGFYRPDGGSIEVIADAPDGPVPKVAFIHQDLALVEDMTVAENVALALGYPRRDRRISWPRVRRQAEEAMDLVAGGISVETKVGELSRADQSLVAIARAVSAECSVLVLDEPTASLPDADVERLFEILERLRQQGVSVLYVTHRLDEVRRMADWVTILRDGRVVADASINDMTDTEIVHGIVGSELTAPTRRPTPAAPPVFLRIDSGQVSNDGGRFDLSIRSGEVVGLAGLRGAGHEIVGRAVAGVEPLYQGDFTIGDRPVAIHTVRDAMSRGIGFATSRREQEALGMTLTARENFFINPSAAKIATRGVLSPRRERALAMRLAKDVALRPPLPEAIVATFSGGNQQKVVLGRWLSIDLNVLVLEEPTMGIDVGARSDIYRLIYRLVDKGLAVIVVSTDFEELAAICDRVLVFDRGEIRTELTGPQLTVNSLIHAASGGAKEIA